MRKGLANYGDAGFSLFLRKAFIKAMGYSDEALDRPIVGITDTSSGYNACHRNVPDLIEAIGRGVMLAGGLPIPFPIISIHESFSHPTSMFLRNLMAMDAEEMIRSQPMDSVVLIGGCDKTVPALLMAAASVDLPAILEVTGPMITGSWRGERLGACTDCRRFWAMHRAGKVSEAETRRDRRPACSRSRHLHGDGHRLDHGAGLGGARHDAAGRRRHPRGRRRPAPSRGGDRRRRRCGLQRAADRGRAR